MPQTLTFEIFFQGKVELHSWFLIIFFKILRTITWEIAVVFRNTTSPRKDPDPLRMGAIRGSGKIFELPET